MRRMSGWRSRAWRWGISRRSSRSSTGDGRTWRRGGEGEWANGRASRAAVLEGRPLPAGRPSSRRAPLRVPLRDTPPGNPPLPAPGGLRYIKGTIRFHLAPASTWGVATPKPHVGRRYRPGPTWDFATPGPTWDFATPGPTWDFATPGPTWDFDTPGPTWDVVTPGPTWDVATPAPSREMAGPQLLPLWEKGCLLLGAGGAHPPPLLVGGIGKTAIKEDGG